MGIISFPLSPMRSVLLAPVQAVAAWFGPAQRASRVYPKPAGAPQPSAQVFPFRMGASNSKTLRCRTESTVTAQPTACIKSQAGKASQACARPAVSRLKVVREFDSAVSPAFAGRMVISGRMADVCAELERMTQRQAAEI